MASRSLNLTNILYGPGTVTVNGGGAEKLSLSLPDLKPVLDNFNIKKVRSEEELVNGQELPFTQAQEAELSLLFDELDTTDFGAIDDGDEIVIASSKGGANGTGITATMSDCDIVYAEAEGFKTKIIARKTAEGDSLSDIITIADNV